MRDRFYIFVRFWPGICGLPVDGLIRLSDGEIEKAISRTMHDLHGDQWVIEPFRRESSKEKRLRQNAIRACGGPYSKPLWLYEHGDEDLIRRTIKELKCELDADEARAEFEPYRPTFWYSRDTDLDELGAIQSDVQRHIERLANGESVHKAKSLLLSLRLKIDRKLGLLHQFDDGQAYLPESGADARGDLTSASITVDADGPVKGYCWRFNGLVVSGFQPAAWKMVDHLWNTENRCASFEDLKGPVYDDTEHLADSNNFGSLRRAANKFFEQHEIPLRASVKKNFVTLRTC